MTKKKKNKSNSNSVKNKRSNIKNKEMKNKKNNISKTTKENKKTTNNNEIKKSVKNKESIISREISVDKDFNIKDKKKVKQLGKSIESFNLFESVKKKTVEENNVEVSSNLNNNEGNDHYLYWENAADNIIDIKEVDDAISYDTNQNQKFILVIACISIIAIILIVVTFYYSSSRANNKKDNIAYAVEVDESSKKK